MLRETSSFLIRGDDGQEYGPVDLDELREWVQENRAGLGTEVRLDEEDSTWEPWQNFPELVALLAEAHAQGGDPLAPLPGMVIAPVWRRVAAWMIDIFIFAILLTPIQLLLDQIMPMNQIVDAISNPTLLQSLPPPMVYQVAAFLVISNSFLVLYFTVCHAGFGQTPAKALLRIRVVDLSGQKPTTIKAFARALALIFSVNLFFPLFYVFMHPQRRTLHDLVADTCVVNA